MKYLIPNVEKIQNVRALVVGDLMLDEYLHGSVTRISPEAPVPVVQADHEDLIAGGAANVMLNMQSLGCQVTGGGYIGQDKQGGRLLKLLYPIYSIGAICDCGLRTIHKIRILADGQHVVRYDRDCDFAQINGRLAAKLAAFDKNEFDVVVVSDYNKGTITAGVMSFIKEYFSCPVLCDIKPVNKSMFKGVDCVTPNLHEARAMTDSLLDPYHVALQLKKSMSLKTIVVTMSDEGILFIDEEDKGFVYKAYTEVDKHDPNRRLDVTGAGDTVTSVLAACLGAGTKFADAVLLSNVAAGVVVNKVGTAVCSSEELINELGKEGYY